MCQARPRVQGEEEEEAAAYYLHRQTRFRTLFAFPTARKAAGKAVNQSVGSKLQFFKNKNGLCPKTCGIDNIKQRIPPRSECM